MSLVLSMVAKPSALSEVSRRPLSQKAWISLSDYYDSLGKKALRDESLVIASSLSKNRAFFLKKVLIRQLTYESYDASISTAKNLLRTDDKSTQIVYQAMSNVFNDEEIIRLILPQEKLDHYSKIILESVVGRELIVWKALPDSTKALLTKNNGLTGLYRRLLRSNNFSQLQRLSLSHSNTGVEENITFNVANIDTPFCWQFQIHPRSTARMSTDTLSIEFSGALDKHPHKVTCYVPMLDKPQTGELVFSGYSKVEGNIKEATQLSVVVHGHKKIIHRNKKLLAQSMNLERWETSFELDEPAIGIEINVSFPKNIESSSSVVMLSNLKLSLRK